MPPLPLLCLMGAAMFGVMGPRPGCSGVDGREALRVAQGEESVQARYIIPIRDPKDVFVSSYHFFVKDGPLQPTRFSPETWFEICLRAGMGPWTVWPVCEKASFAYMKRIDDKFRDWQMIPWANTAAPMMRKGERGSSGDLLSPDQQRLDEHFMAELQRLGSDFPYQDFCDVSPGLKATA